MFGGLIEPFMSNVMSGLAETMAEQQQTIDSLMGEARSYLQADDAVAQALGDPIQVVQPFSQSSSTQTIKARRVLALSWPFPSRVVEEQVSRVCCRQREKEFSNSHSTLVDEPSP